MSKLEKARKLILEQLSELSADVYGWTLINRLGKIADDLEEIEDEI